MKEQLVNLEKVKILEEKGFEFVFGSDETYNVILSNKILAVPTQSEVQRWLREMCNINISINFKPNVKKWDFIPYNMNMNGKEYVKNYSEYTKLNSERRYETYEEALEDGITESLLMI